MCSTACGGGMWGCTNLKSNIWEYDIIALPSSTTSGRQRKEKDSHAGGGFDNAKNAVRHAPVRRSLRHSRRTASQLLVSETGTSVGGVSAMNDANVFLGVVWMTPVRRTRLGGVT